MPNTRFEIKSTCFIWGCWAVVFFVCFPIANVAAQTEFRAGTAKVRITPHVPIPMSGYGSRKEPFKGVHDDIFARVVVLDDGARRAAIISLETIGIANSFWDHCTARISKETGIPRQYLWLTAVHNHNGPTMGVYTNEVSPEVRAYVEELETKVVQATRHAVSVLTPATIGAGKGECKMNINRRASNGKGAVTLGRNPYGPCDHEVGVVLINNKAAGKPLAVLVDWPCHAVVLGPKNYMITGDWPGAASRYLEKKLGKGVVAPMIIGASGDINPIYGPHIDFEKNRSYAFGKEAIGEDLGKETLRVIHGIRTSSNGRLVARERVILLPRKSSLAKDDGIPGSIENAQVKVRLSAMRIGNIVLVGVSGEVFNQIGVRIREQSPFCNTFMVTHCNGSCGYLITEDAYAVGGYEVRVTQVKTGAEKAIIENLLDMIGQL